jgi:flagella basal body P-ring formation protein FlgA
MHAPSFARAVVGVALIAANAAQGAAFRTEPDQIRAAAEAHIVGLGGGATTVHATAGRLDPRLNLAPCVGELTPFLPAGATIRPRTVVGVRCEGPSGWSIYVPVTVESDAQVLIARRSLARGVVPSPADLEATLRRVPGLAAQFPATAADIGSRRLRRAVAAGEILAADALAPTLLVDRGQQVTLLAAEAGIAVRAGAVALEAGGFGDRVRARNAASGRIIEGIVQADGTLRAAP